MVAKLFITKFFANQKNKVNRNKFFAYKNNNNNNNHTSLKVERENCHRNIKFKVYSTNRLKKYKILKNNKFVFINDINSDENCKCNIRKNSKKAHKKSINWSKYRGVSKNGNKWQVLLTNDKIKYYFGNYNSQEVAAKIYDLFSLKFRGKKAITNFFYNDEQIKKIYEMKLNKSDS